MNYSVLKETLNLTREPGLRLGACRVTPSVLPVFLGAAENSGLEVVDVTFHQDTNSYLVIGEWAYFNVVEGEDIPSYKLLVQEDPKTGKYTIGLQLRVVDEMVWYDTEGGVNFPTISHSVLADQD